MQALLGLTDIKLKNELSLMVDMTLWVAAVQDVKSREKASKSRASDISVELRIRKEELDRVNSSVHELSTALKQAELEVKLLRDSLDAPLYSSVASGSTIRAEDISSNITSLEREIDRYRTHVIDVFRKNAENEMKQEIEQVHRVELELSVVKQSQAKLDYVVRNSLNMKNSLESQGEKLKSQIEQASMELSKLLNGLTEFMHEDYQLDMLREHMNEFRTKVQSESMRLAECDVRIANTEESLKQLRNFNEKCRHDDSHSSNSGLTCPTCGQAYGAESVIARISGVNADLDRFLGEKLSIKESLSRATTLYDIALNAISTKERIDSLVGTHYETLKELAQQKLVAEQLLAEQRDLDIKIARLQDDRRLANENKNMKENLRETTVREMEDRLSSMIIELEALRVSLIPVKFNIYREGNHSYP